MFTGKLTHLRPVEMTDLDRYLLWINDAEVNQYLKMRPPVSREDEEEFLRKSDLKTRPPEVLMAIELLEERKHIGSVGFEHVELVDRRATLGIMIGEKNCWSRGYGTDAILTMVRYGFEELNLNRVDLTCDERNARGIACYRKCGFTEEGRLKQHRFAKGRYWDTVVMAVLADDFFTANGRSAA
jgi:RimJ/RimL family protein N-acetyltransferase